MVEVSLMKLVAIKGTEGIWPEEFIALVKKMEQEPNDRTTFGAMADWCDEHNEPEYAEAWRFLLKRP